MNRAWMLLVWIVFSLHRIFATLLLELCSTLIPDAIRLMNKYLIEG